MANQKNGEVSWSDGGSSGERTKGKDLYLKLGSGSNIVRLLTAPYQYYQHKFKFPNEKTGYGHRINCSGAHGSCAVCAQGDKPKRRWLVGVLDRKSNAYKVLDISWAIFKNVQDYNRDIDWGDPTSYDIDIVVNPNAPPANYYSTVPKPKKPLSANDMVIKDQADVQFLIDRTTAPDPQKTEERYEALRGEFGGGPGNMVPQAEPKTQVQAPSSDDDSDFPDYDDKTGF